MKKFVSFLLVLVFVASSFAIPRWFSTPGASFDRFMIFKYPLDGKVFTRMAQPDISIRQKLIDQLVLETKDFELSGTIKEVIMTFRGKYYIVLDVSGEEKQVPAGSLLKYVKVELGKELTVTGKDYTVLVPRIVSIDSYNLYIGNPRIVKKLLESDKVEKKELELKVKTIDLRKGVLVLVGEDNKEFNVPISIVPNLKNLKTGDVVKVEGIVRNVKIYQNFKYGDKNYKF